VASPKKMCSGIISVTVIRHWRERLSKCSLTPLQGREDITFIKAKHGFSFDAEGYTVLALGAPVLSQEDAHRPLLLLDSTWRLLSQLKEGLRGKSVPRSLPSGIETAYPRVSKVFADPLGGLASIEALYLAKRLLGKDDLSLLDQYPWKDAFLAKLQHWEAQNS